MNSKFKVLQLKEISTSSVSATPLFKDKQDFAKVHMQDVALQFHLKNISEAKLTKQNLSVFHSCTANSLNFNKCLQTKKKSAPGQMKPLTFNEILQFLILAGRKKKNTSVFHFSWPKSKNLSQVDPNKFPLSFAPIF